MKQNIKEKVRAEFGFVPTSETEVFELCYSRVADLIPASRSMSFLALHGFYRGLSAALLVLVAMTIFLGHWRIGVASLVAFFVTVWRFRYYGRKFARSVYVDFLVSRASMQRYDTSHD